MGETTVYFVPSCELDIAKNNLQTICDQISSDINGGSGMVLYTPIAYKKESISTKGLVITLALN